MTSLIYFIITFTSISFMFSHSVTNSSKFSIVFCYLYRFIQTLIRFLKRNKESFSVKFASNKIYLKFTTLARQLQHDPSRYPSIFQSTPSHVLTIYLSSKNSEVVPFYSFANLIPSSSTIYQCELIVFRGT